MNEHLNDGQLRACLDGENGAAESAHLEQCAACRARLAEIKSHASFAGQRMAFLALAPEKDLSPARTALARFKQSLTTKETSMFNSIFKPKFRPVWTTLAVIILLVGIFSIPTVRVSAGQFLGLFRVQQVTALPVDISNLTKLTGNDALGTQLSQLISSDVTIDQQPAKPQSVANAADASAKAGFTVRLPSSPATDPQLTVQGGAAFHMVVDRARAQALLDEAGFQNIVLPASVDGAKISVNVPNSVSAAYGTCPKMDGTDASGTGSAGRRYPDCVALVQIPSPTVNAPPDLDVAQLAELGLQMTGMTPEQAKAYSQTVDWTSTLIIPIPKNAAVYQQVQVDGVTGTLIQRPADDAPQYALVWVKDGIIYAISALGTDSANAIAMANSMK